MMEFFMAILLHTGLLQLLKCPKPDMQNSIRQAAYTAITACSIFPIDDAF